MRPYTLDFLRAVYPTFDIAIFSQLPLYHITQIVHHIETVLNLPVLNFIRMIAHDRLARDKRYLHLKNMRLKPVTFFKCIMHKDQYVYLDKANEYVENLEILTVGRPKENIIFMSNDPFSYCYSYEWRI